MISLVHSTHYFADIGDHVMPIRKFGLVREAIAASDLPHRFVQPFPATDVDLLRVHTKAYVEAVKSGHPAALAASQKFPWSPALAESVRWTNGGCITAGALAIEEGLAGNLASGFHHAHADHGEGFCTFNGLVVALEHLRAKGKLERALVLDMDLHYGNGTAALLASRPWAHQLSIYGNFYENNKAIRDVTEKVAPDTENCRTIAVPAGTGAGGYLELLSAGFPAAVDRARPDLVMFQAGADPLKEDPYSPLDLDHDALRARDRYVFQYLRQRGIPVMWVLAGGYTPDVKKVVQVHLNTFIEASNTVAH